MIACDKFFGALTEQGVGYFAGVPDSLLKDICAYITDHVAPANHIIAANEGAAVALATGYHLATDKIGLVYLQNSGLGNVVNPLLSLADPEVYSIPLLLLIGWRGEPGVPDEPQHRKQGRVTRELLNAMEVPHAVLPGELGKATQVLAAAVVSARERRAPYALLVRKGTFAPYALKAATAERGELRREEALGLILDQLDRDEIVVATTGMASREVFEYRAAKRSGHARDFLTVGSMGHASQIALGLAGEKPEREVWCLDGDGAALMHLGSLAIAGASGAKNFRHIVLNNGAHDSVGGQPTVGRTVDFPAIAEGCGYRWARVVETAAELAQAVREMREMREMRAAVGPALLEVRVKRGARAELGRPTTSTWDNKREFMAYVRA